MALVEEGFNDCEIAQATGVPRRTVLDWRHGRGGLTRVPDAAGTCPSCGHATHDFTALPRASYSYLLGLYLGDGHIVRQPRTWKLRISLDMNWPGIMLECENATRDVFPKNRVRMYRQEPESWCAVVSVHSQQLVCLFPQHGPGPKHLRRIELTDWQTDLVTEQPEKFLRGLIHSDGCRFANRIRHGDKTYSYPRYNFTNASDDIRGLFTAACDQLGIEWKAMNARNISVARRASVARLDEFVGPKN
jgi:hypothetical protein